MYNSTSTMEINSTQVWDMETEADTYAYDYNEYEYLFLGDPGQLSALLEALVYITGITGILSNGVVLFVLCHGNSSRSYLKPSDMLLLNQSAIDLTISILLLVTYIPWFSGTPTKVRVTFWGELYCRLINNEVLLYIGMYTNCFNIAVIAGERLLMVVYAVLHRTWLTWRKTVVIIILTWILAILLNIQSVLSTSAGHESCNFIFAFNSKMYNEVHGYLVIIFTFFLPITFIIYAYLRMVVRLRKSGQVQTNLATSTEAEVGRPSSSNIRLLSSRQVNILKLMMIISVVYVLTWTPVQVYYFMFCLGMPLSFADAYYYIGTSLAILNSTINPFIYIFKYPAFRKRAQKVFRLLRHAEVSPGMESTSVPADANVAVQSTQTTQTMHC